MPTLQVRELPETIYNALVDQARKEHRSITQQATYELSKALQVERSYKERRADVICKLQDWQKKWQLIEDVDPAELIREDRDR